MTEPTDGSREDCFIIDASIAGELHGATICIKEERVAGVPVRVGILRLGALTESMIKDLIALKNIYEIDVLGILPRSGSEEVSVLLEKYGPVLQHLGVKKIIREPEPAEKLAVKSLVIRPQIDSRDAMKIFIGKVRGQLAGFMGSLAGRRVEFLGLELAYLPLRCYEIMYHRRFGGEEDLTAQEAEYCFELSTGTLVTIEDGRLVVDSTLTELGELDDVVVTAYEYIGRKGEVSIDELAEILGSLDRAEIVVRMLVDYGLLEPVGLNTYVPQGPEEPSNVVKYFLKRGLAVEGKPPRCSRILGPGIEVDILDRIVKVWGVIKKIWDVYYPVYVGVFRKWKGDEGLEVATIVDAVSGERLEDIEELIASSKVMYIIDDIINTILNKAEKGEKAEPTCPPEASKTTG